MKTLLKALAALSLAASSFVASAGSLWFDNGGAINRLDTGTNQVATQVSGASPKDMAAVPDGALWVLGQGTLRKYGAAGAILIDLGLQTDDLTGAKVLTRDRYTGDLWVADVIGSGNQRLVAQLDAQGNRLSQFVASGGTRSIALDLDPSIWLLTNQQLLHYATGGTTLATVNLQGMLANPPQLMAVDALRRIVWLAGGSQLARLDGTTPNAAPQVIALPANAVAIDVDQETGAVWVASADALSVYSASGAFVRTISTASLGNAKALAFDAQSGLAWFGYVGGIAGFNRDGTQASNLILGQTVVRIAANAFIPAPSVAITTPATNSVFTAPASFTLVATASEVGAAIASVQFFRNGTSIGTATSSPYQVSVTNLAAGTYTFTAVATDSHGTSTTSSAITVTVNSIANTPPTVSITAPASGTVVAAPASFSITADASDSDGTVAKVDFYQGATFIGTSASAPYSVSLSGVGSGTYSFTAKATDNLGASTTSSAVQVTVDALPAVSITAPTNNAIFVAPASITITATASDPDGSISKVEFYQGPSLVGTATVAPYVATVTGLAAGTYTFTAQATDNRGLSTTSALVSVIVNAPPTVSVTTPASGTVVAAPASFAITASAGDSDGSIAKVEFFQGAALIGTATAAPYSASVSNLAAGSYSFTAKATDNLGASTTSGTVQVVVDALPAVSITAPANNAIYTAPASITLTAAASDSDGTVAKVEFFQGATLVGTATSAPYSVTLANVATGSYSFTAKATDNLGLSTTSAAIAVLVNAPPSVSITAPPDGTVVAAPASFSITADASDSDGSVTKVEFYQGATLVGTSTAAPYSASVVNLAAGSYSFTAKATDNLGATTTSAVVQVIVDALPAVSITAPANNAVFTAPATVSLTASASDSDGTISKVEFFQGASLVGTVTTAPYTAIVSGLAAGSYTFTAKATDNLGLATTSAPISVLVNSPPAVSITAPGNNAVFAAPGSFTITADASDSDGSITKVEFYQGATLIATATSAPYAANVSSMAAGSYTFTAKATDNLGATMTSAAVQILVDTLPSVSITAPGNNAVFTAPGAITLTASASDSDGSVTKVEFFQGASLVGTSTTAPYTVTLTGVAAGSYSYTAKATDNAGLSSTSSAVAVVVNAPPSVAITAPANGAAFASPGSFTLTADASDSDGSIGKVEFFQGATLVGTATTAPYAASVSGLASGTYSFTAKATDNLGATTTSSAVQVVVSAAPTVSITAPANNTVYPAPSSVTLTAVANDPDGNIAKVEFYQGAALVGTVTAAPYSATLSSLPAGNYVFTAKATDNAGLTTTSSTVTVIVDALPTVSLTAPANGATFTAPATITLSASASDMDGTIAKVEFYQGASIIGTVTTAPYSFIWTNVAQGSYSLTAKATDDRGLSSSSAAIAITVKAPAQLHYIHPDQLGTPRMITRTSDNQVMWRWDNTEPFGNSQPNENPSGVGAFTFNQRFPGQYFDSETGTSYNYFRDYEPSLGRFLQSDPFEVDAGLATFAYVESNPLGLIDPFGLASCGPAEPPKFCPPKGLRGWARAIALALCLISKKAPPPEPPPRPPRPPNSVPGPGGPKPPPTPPQAPPKK